MKPFQPLKKIPRDDGYAILFLFFATLYYGHRLYGVNFTPEGDSIQNLFFRMNEALLRADYDPFKMTYYSTLSVAGLYNPLGLLLKPLTWLAGHFLSATAAAFLTCITISLLSLFAVGLSFYLVFRRLGFSVLEALVATLLPTYSGFSLVGVNEFDYFYLWSLIFVPWVLDGFLRLEGWQHVKRAMGIALLIGLSLWGGGNTPLFYFLPGFCLLPFLKIRGAQKGRQIWLLVLLEGFIAVLSLLVSAVTLAPAIAFNGESNRADLHFQSEIPSLSFYAKIVTLFFHEWTRIGGWHFHETDYFVGLPTIILAVIGLRFVLTTKTFRNEQYPILLVLGIGAMLGCLISHFSYLPGWMQIPIETFYQAQSIRHPNRFFYLALPPLGYLAGLGFRNVKNQGTLVIAGVCSSLFIILALLTAPSTWDSMYGENKLAFIIGVTLSVGGTLLIGSLWKFKKHEWCLRVGLLFSIFLLYALAPVQFTRYTGELHAQNSKETLLVTDVNAANYVGFGLSYSQPVEFARKLLFDLPPYLSNPDTLKGRVIDTSNYAPPIFVHQNKHKYAFAGVTNPAGLKRLKDLIHLKNDMILDLTGVCWIVPANQELIKSSSCFPLFFSLSGYHTFFFPDDQKQWLRKATRYSLAREFGIDCQETDCGQLPPSSAGQTLTPIVPTTETPDWLEFQLSPGPATFLFASIPYRSNWKAFVDEKITAIIAADIAFMAIPIPANAKTVRLVLDHGAQQWGMFVSIASSLILLATMLFLRKR